MFLRMHDLVHASSASPIKDIDNQRLRVHGAGTAGDDERVAVSAVLGAYGILCKLQACHNVGDQSSYWRVMPMMSNSASGRFGFDVVSGLPDARSLSS